MMQNVGIPPKLAISQFRNMLTAPRDLSAPPRPGRARHTVPGIVTHFWREHREHHRTGEIDGN